LIDKAIAVSLLLLATPVAAGDLVGQATVIDGDTLEIRGQRIRLHGVDAPESRQLCQKSRRNYRCGQQAARALDARIGGRPVRCEERGTDRYGRIVAECYVGDVSLNAWLVRQGHAVAYREYSKDHIAEEAAAQTARRGIWAGTFQMPWDWRAAQRTSKSDAGSASRPSSANGCRIKGNISPKGDRIYHLPSGRSYGRTSIDERKGERWFCTVAEARTAGWRPADQ
jgi:endonuclease YncB( thermonuclease family)